MKFKIKHIILFVIFGLQIANAQKIKDRNTLEREKKRNLEKISQVKKILNETKQEKLNTVGQIKAYSQQIENQETKINLAKEDIELIKVEMVDLEKNQSTLFSKLKKLQEEYADIIYREAKNSNKLTELSFLFSSTSLSEMFLRYKYLEQYSENKRMQLDEIKKIGSQLKDKQKSLISKKINRQSIITEIETETTELESLKTKQNELLAELTDKEGDLKTELEKSKAAVGNLNTLIASIITKDKKTKAAPKSARGERAEAIALREAKMREAAGKTNNNANVATAPGAVAEGNFADIKLSGKSFGTYKNKLGWPVNGFISDRFGVKSHPYLKGVKVDNNGVDIQTNSNAAVKAVFEGTVLDISNIPGLNNVIAIQHGEYYTVYANLSSAAVRVNQTVKMGQNLGTAANKHGSPEINFQIWYNFKKLNPEQWLGAK